MRSVKWGISILAVFVVVMAIGLIALVFNWANSWTEQMNSVTRAQNEKLKAQRVAFPKSTDTKVAEVKPQVVEPVQNIVRFGPDFVSTGDPLEAQARKEFAELMNQYVLLHTTATDLVWQLNDQQVWSLYTSYKTTAEEELMEAMSWWQELPQNKTTFGRSVSLELSEQFNNVSIVQEGASSSNLNETLQMWDSAWRTELVKAEAAKVLFLPASAGSGAIAWLALTESQNTHMQKHMYCQRAYEALSSAEPEAQWFGHLTYTQCQNQLKVQLPDPSWVKAWAARAAPGRWTDWMADRGKSSQMDWLQALWDQMIFIKSAHSYANCQKPSALRLGPPCGAFQVYLAPAVQSCEGLAAKGKSSVMSPSQSWVWMGAWYWSQLVSGSQGFDCARIVLSHWKSQWKAPVLVPSSGGQFVLATAR